MVGTASVYIDEVPNVEDPENGEPQEAWCFDADAIRVETNKRIGTITDCLIVSVDNADCGTLLVISTTFFDDERGNVLVARGPSTVSPTATGSSPDVTHITGQMPSSGTNSILYGIGKYKHSKGSVRLAGGVNMSNFNPMGQNGPEGEITFDCLFVLDLKTKRRSAQY